jgi:hypothetical protein
MFYRALRELLNKADSFEGVVTFSGEGYNTLPLNEDLGGWVRGIHPVEGHDSAAA